MSLGGMAIAIGSLVDDAIINVENAYKRLRQNRQKPISERQSSFTVVFEAAKEIQASIVNATLIIIVQTTRLNTVVLPVILLFICIIVINHHHPILIRNRFGQTVTPVSGI